MISEEAESRDVMRGTLAGPERATTEDEVFARKPDLSNHVLLIQFTVSDRSNVRDPRTTDRVALCPTCHSHRLIASFRRMLNCRFPSPDLA